MVKAVSQPVGITTLFREECSLEHNDIVASSTNEIKFQRMHMHLVIFLLEGKRYQLFTKIFR